MLIDDEQHCLQTNFAHSQHSTLPSLNKIDFLSQILHWSTGWEFKVAASVLSPGTVCIDLTKNVSYKMRILWEILRKCLHCHPGVPQLIRCCRLFVNIMRRVLAVIMNKTQLNNSQAIKFGVAGDQLIVLTGVSLVMTLLMLTLLMTLMRMTRVMTLLMTQPWSSVADVRHKVLLKWANQSSILSQP